MSELSHKGDVQWLKKARNTEVVSLTLHFAAKSAVTLHHANDLCVGDYYFQVFNNSANITFKGFCIKIIISDGQTCCEAENRPGAEEVFSGLVPADSRGLSCDVLATLASPSLTHTATVDSQ